MAIGLERLRLRSRSVVHDVGAVVLTAIAGLISVFGLLILENPLLWRIDVGGAVFNLLLLGYALPAVLMLLLSYAVAGGRGKAYANTIAGGALFFALATSHWRSAASIMARSSPAARRRAPSNTPIRSAGSPSAWCCSVSAFSSTPSVRGWRLPWSSR